MKRYFFPFILICFAISCSKPAPFDPRFSGFEGSGTVIGKVQNCSDNTNTWLISFEQYMPVPINRILSRDSIVYEGDKYYNVVKVQNPPEALQKRNLRISLLELDSISNNSTIGCNTFVLVSIKHFDVNK
ncbi:hypothetical protein [Thermoflexibacter ruber]|uniref:Uncharacterized protein n=1 Tax=Thermoflexibacter ruber TaxID=1003 RepID=A0A1I2JUS8_9BACT|nr:hypothetical protein [Thermoflexibacter ruber]SFF56566.1 hypothetical protein SAMN04488541_105917 [Thermoflexibacter ruber]